MWTLHNECPTASDSLSNLRKTSLLPSWILALDNFLVYRVYTQKTLLLLLLYLEQDTELKEEISIYFYCNHL